MLMAEEVSKEVADAVWPTLEASLAMGASLATIVAVLVGGIGGYIAWRQYQSQVRHEAESRAKTLFAECVRLCIEYPRFAEPNKLSEFSDLEIISYKWFVGAQLNMCEEMTRFSEESHWRHEVGFIIALHEEWICGEEFQCVDIQSYEEPLRSMLVRQPKSLPAAKPESAIAAPTLIGPGSLRKRGNTRRSKGAGGKR